MMSAVRQINKTAESSAKKINKLLVKTHYIHLNWRFCVVFALVESSIHSSFEMKLVVPLLSMQNGIDRW